MCRERADLSCFPLNVSLLPLGARQSSHGGQHVRSAEIESVFTQLVAKEVLASSCNTASAQEGKPSDFQQSQIIWVAKAYEKFVTAAVTP